MSNLDRVTEAARAITNLGLPDNCVYSELTPFEQSVVNEFFQVCFANRRELQDDTSLRYSLSELEDAYERGWNDGYGAGYNR